MRARTVGFSALAFAALSFPLAAMAQQVARDLDSWIGTFIRLLNGVVFLFIALAVVIFIWGLIQYLTKLGGEDGGKGGIKLMIWGIIALFVMVSVWGLVRILQGTLGIGSNENAQVPKVPGAPSSGSIQINVPFPGTR